MAMSQSVKLLSWAEALCGAQFAMRRMERAAIIVVLTNLRVVGELGGGSSCQF